MKKIEIEIPEGKKTEWVNGVLTLVDDKPKDVTQRIKTFEDAKRDLPYNHPALVDYLNTRTYKLSSNLDAYLKLCIICAALNEGWEPKFKEVEWRYHPWFALYTKDELENIPKGTKENRVTIDTSNYNTEYVGFALMYPNSLRTCAYINPHLCLKTHDLAEYCGRQFIDIWADYLLRRK